MPATATSRCRLRGGVLRYRIQPARMPRMALAQALRRQKAAFDRAVFVNRFDSVSGAGGVKTAILAKEWADAQLVCAQ